jgi:hypothetical protein
MLSRATKTVLLHLSGIVVSVFLLGMVLYALQWAHVIERFLTICDRNPGFLADCREK